MALEKRKEIWDTSTRSQTKRYGDREGRRGDHRCNQDRSWISSITNKTIWTRKENQRGHMAAGKDRTQKGPCLLIISIRERSNGRRRF